MTIFENQLCDVCGEVFDKNSDIVVCPECGTPHHRHCWQKNGHCINEAKHSEGFEWKPALPKVSATDGDVKCENCGRMMPRGTLFCENCGSAIKQPAKPEPVQTFNMGGGRTVRMYQFPDEQGYQQRINRRMEEKLDGEGGSVSYKDAAAYIGYNSQYYMFKFRKMDANPKYKPFNWTAFMFTPLWFLFRKMWPMAIATGLFNLITSIPTLILLYVDAGLLPADSRFLFPGIEMASSVLSVIAILAGIVFGFMAVPMYRKDTIKRIKKLKETAKGDAKLYYTLLISESGPSKIGMIVVALFAAFMMFSAM